MTRQYIKSLMLHLFLTSIDVGTSFTPNIITPTTISTTLSSTHHHPHHHTPHETKTAKNKKSILHVSSLQGDENLTHRARVEESFLNDNQGTLTMASPDDRTAASKWIKDNIKVKSRARSSLSGGGGFGGAGGGGGSSKKKAHTTYAPRTDSNGFGAVVLRDGVARINNSLSSTTAERLLMYINNRHEMILSDEEEEEEDGSSSSEFANVLAKENRWDMYLPLEESDAVMAALRELLVDGDVGGAMESVLGKGAVLYELATLISDPGSEQQVLHTDFPFQDTLPPALTCFVALQDIKPNMGPTIFLPGSATAAHHADLKDRLWQNANSRSGLVANAPNVRSTLGTGDASLYNPMTLHCGGANRSDKRRVLFYVSFKNMALRPSTEGASIRKDIGERELTLGGLKKLLKERVKLEES